MKASIRYLMLAFVLRTYLISAADHSRGQGWGSFLFCLLGEKAE
jgi:hypothetical protein